MPLNRNWGFFSPVFDKDIYLLKREFLKRENCQVERTEVFEALIYKTSFGMTDLCLKETRLG